jgi:hypothetical protein
MAKYKLLEPAYINHCLYGEGDVVVVGNDVIPGPHMLPIDNDARRKAKEVGLLNQAVPNYIDEITGRIDVTRYGASPQDAAAGIMLDSGAEGVMGPEHLKAPY